MRRRLTGVLVSLVALGCFTGREPREAELQLIAFSGRLTHATTKTEVMSFVRNYPLLRVDSSIGDRRLTLRTPPRFGARDWLALLEFTPEQRLLRVAFGMTDYAPIRPRYPDAVPEKMPSDQCYGTAAECARPWS
jgi:hypothetical protein